MLLSKKIKDFLKTLKQILTRNIVKKNFENKFISNDFGFGRGTPVDRYYIHDFFCKKTKYISGDCLEFGDTTYIDKYGIDVNESVTFNYSTVSSAVEDVLTGDITQLYTLPQNKFDCIVCINVLNFIYDLPAAVLGLSQMLKPDGKIILTLAGISAHISRYDMDRWGDYWRLTDKAAIKLFEDAGFNVEEVCAYGNAYACTAQINGFSVEDIELYELFPSHPDYQLVLAFVLSKSVN